MVTLKTINYRGGIARFQVPSSWMEEYEPQGGGTFYEVGEDTGTLRINVMDFESPADKVIGAKTAYDLLTSLESVGETECLPSGNAIARSSRTGLESGENLLIYTWHVGVCVTPTHFRMVVFTYTILAAQEHEPTMQQELELLDRSIANGEYPAVRGVAGDYVHE